MYLKMAAVYPPIPTPPSSSSLTPLSGIICCAGGPALMYYVTPSEGELFKRFSPDLQKRNLEARERRTAEYLDFAGKMREYSKSDKPIWEAAEEAQRKKRAEMIEVDRARMMEEERVKSEMREAQREEMRR